MIYEIIHLSVFLIEFSMLSKLLVKGEDLSFRPQYIPIKGSAVPISNYIPKLLADFEFFILEIRINSTFSYVNDSLLGLRIVFDYDGIAIREEPPMQLNEFIIDYNRINRSALINVLSDPNHLKIVRNPFPETYYEKVGVNDVLLIEKSKSYIFIYKNQNQTIFIPVFISFEETNYRFLSRSYNFEWKQDKYIYIFDPLVKIVHSKLLEIEFTVNIRIKSEEKLVYKKDPEDLNETARFTEKTLLYPFIRYYIENC